MSEYIEVLKRIGKLEEDMYLGRGKENPSITTRLSLIEDTLSSLKTVKWLLAGAIITAIFNIVSSHVKFNF